MLQWPFNINIKARSCINSILLVLVLPNICQIAEQLLKFANIKVLYITKHQMKIQTRVKTRGEGGNPKRT